MAPGVWNIVIGAIMLVGGLTGKLRLIGTGSSGALAVVGGAVAAYGVYQFVRSRRA